MSPRGCQVLTEHLSFNTTVEQLAALNELCERYTVQRGVVIRDALAFYLSIAADEKDDKGALRGMDAVPPRLAPDKVRRPDGVVVSLTDAVHLGAVGRKSASEKTAEDRFSEKPY